MRKTRDEFYSIMNERCSSCIETLDEILSVVLPTMKMEEPDDIIYDTVYDGTMSVDIVGIEDSLRINFFGDMKCISVEYSIRNRAFELDYASTYSTWYNFRTGMYEENVPIEKRRSYVLDRAQWIIEGIAYQIKEYYDATSLKYSKEIQKILLSKMSDETMAKIVESCLTPEQLEEANRLIDIASFK